MVSSRWTSNRNVIAHQLLSTRRRLVSGNHDSPKFRMKNNYQSGGARVWFKPVWLWIAHTRIVAINCVNSFFTLWTQVNIWHSSERLAITRALRAVTTVTVHRLPDALNGEFGDCRVATPSLEESWTTKGYLSPRHLCLSIYGILGIDSQQLISRTSKLCSMAFNCLWQHLSPPRFLENRFLVIMY